MNLNSSSLLNKSAVVVLLEEITDSLVLTQRSKNLRDHPGEICFPGGRWQADDADLWITALRELQEELGVAAPRIHLLKKLEIERTHNGSIIQPWFATIPTLSPYTSNEQEVADVFTLPMSDVRVITNYIDIVVERDGQRVKTCQFTASDFFIWGATARIMKQLCEREVI